LGCSSILGPRCHVHFCGIVETDLPADPDHRITQQAREAELTGVAGFFGYQYTINRSSRVNRFTVAEQINSLENIINKIRPTTIFIPFQHGYNQDHRTIYDACKVALRPHDRNHFVKRVFVYEAIHDLLWSSVPFEPMYFVPLDIERKIEGYLRHKSQVRAMRSADMINAHARVRGMAANCAFAEAFMVARWVE
jgi:LmbE family N-acetylglucosaminyl deacetylase